MFQSTFITFLITIMGLTICEQSYAQKKIDNDFRSPMDIPLFLSGNFGEMRTNHFHTGLDIKTQGVEGKRIYAIADGYVSRIKKSPWGYGNVVYVTHSTGYTSVYAHLSRFNAVIDSFYRAVQIKKEVFALDLYPGPNILRVKKGDVIAYSGNSGSSGGPHLHFEIRDTKTENPLNPMLFGFNIKDNLPPRIQGIRVYRFPSDSGSGICNLSHPVTGGNGQYYLKNKQIVLNGYGDYGFAVHATDMLNGSGNICGIHTAQLYFDGALIFEQRIDSLDFYTNRYMNAHTDYALYRATKKSYHKSFQEPNDQLRIYTKIKNRGRITINDTKQHKVVYKIFDVSGNKSEIAFHVINKTDAPMTATKLDRPIINCCSNSSFNYDKIKLYFPKGTLYNNTPLEYYIQSRPKGALSERHVVNSTNIPVQQYFFIEINCSVPNALQEKVLLVEEDGGLLYAHGGSYENGWLMARVRTFGHFYAMVDTVNPVIRFLNVSNGGRLTQKKIYVSAADNLSGVSEYAAYINNNWAPTEYDAKRKRYIIHMNEISVPRGTVELRFKATDERNNTSTRSIKFTY